MKSLHIRNIFFIGIFFAGASAWAQVMPDSSYTVAPPDGYQIPGIRLDSSVIEIEIDEEVVMGALTDPDLAEMYDLQFDTAMAIELRGIESSDYYVPLVSDELIKDRLSCLQNRVPLNFHERVRVFIDYYAIKRRDFTLRVMQRKNIYFPLFERILAEYGMPDELKYLAIIESALIPTARSRVGAVGLWQFMPATGKMFGLKQDGFIDFRQDPEKATRAACKYLQQLYNIFGNWELAIASYNCGPGNVRKAMRRSGGDYYFWDIYQYLPRETRSYLPQFVAMMYIVNYAEEHHIIQDQPDYLTDAQAVYVDGPLDLNVMAEELRVCVEDLVLLNPELKRAAVPSGYVNYKLMIPEKRYSEFAARRSEILDNASKNVSYETVSLGWKGGGAESKFTTEYSHIVRKGEVLGNIAANHRVSVDQLRQWNGISGHYIYPGQKLVIYTGERNAAVAKTTSSVAKPKAGTATHHTVRRGEVLGSIANRYNISVSELRSWNGLRNDRIYAGQKLRVVEGSSKPAPASTPVVQASHSAGNSNSLRYHTVKSGEVLGGIANKYGVSVASIRAWNGLSGNTIRVGQKLQVSAGAPKSAPAKKGTGGTYTVRSGDSLWGIASKFGISVDELKRMNNLTGNALKIGQTLKVR